MPPLDPTLQKTLEKKIIEARDAAEGAAETAIQTLAVHEKGPYLSLTEDKLWLQPKARQFGTGPGSNLGPLVEECAYEQWHRMHFAREEGDPDAWATASRYASSMLPGISRTGDPLLGVLLFPEGRRSLPDRLPALWADGRGGLPRRGERGAGRLVFW